MNLIICDDPVLLKAKLKTLTLEFNK